MPTVARFLLFLPFAALGACGGATTERDPVADARFANEKRIGQEDVTKRQEADANFMVDAATGSRLGLELAQLAQRRSTTPAIRAWAQQLDRDAAALGASLRTVASQKGLSVPDALSDDQREIIEKLTPLSGAEFDRRLLEAATEYLDDAHDTFADMADEAYDGDIRGVAAKYAPTLKQHYDQADELEDQLKP